MVWANELQMETQEPTSFVTLDRLLNLCDESAAYKQKLYDLKAIKTPLNCFPPQGKTHRTLQCMHRLKRKSVLLSLPFVHLCASSQCCSLCEDVLIPWSTRNTTHCHKDTCIAKGQKRLSQTPSQYLYKNSPEPGPVPGPSLPDSVLLQYPGV